MGVEYAVKRMLSSFNRLKWTMAFGGLAIGVVAGFIVVMYRMSIEYGTDFARSMFAFLRVHPLLIIPCALAAVIIGLFAGFLITKEPMASGSGIPQLQGVVIKGMRMKWQTIIPTRFIAGILASLFGLSLGREGPSIQMGACGAQFLAHRVRHGKREDTSERYLVTAGAAAGLSAAFSAPLSGMMFAVEEVHRSFSPAILMGATAASLTADFVSKYCFGLRPVLDFGNIAELQIGQYIWLIPLGIIAGFVGAFINHMLLGLQTLMGMLPKYTAPVAALLFAIPVGLFLPEVLGGGASLIKGVEHAQFTLGMLAILFFMKTLFTSTSFGCGTPGGIFMPILTIGSLAGGWVGTFGHNFLGLSPKLIGVFAVCTMAGTLAASVKAPVTSILLTVEMTGTLIHMLPVATVAFIALLVSDVLRVKPIYGALLERYIEEHGTETSNFAPSANGVLEFPVQLGSIADGKRVRDVRWPSGCLLVGLRRAEYERVPRGDTKVQSGDYLIVLFSGEDEQFVRLGMHKLCDSDFESVKSLQKVDKESVSKYREDNEFAPRGQNIVQSQRVINNNPVNSNIEKQQTRQSREGAVAATHTANIGQKENKQVDNNKSAAIRDDGVNLVSTIEKAEKYSQE